MGKKKAENLYVTVALDDLAFEAVSLWDDPEWVIILIICRPRNPRWITAITTPRKRERERQIKRGVKQENKYERLSHVPVIRLVPE